MTEETQRVMSRTPLLFVLSCILLMHYGHSAAPDQSKSGTSPSDLRRDLFRNYDKKAIPVKNFGDSVTSTTGLTFLFIRELQEDKEILVVDAWILMKWNDSYLRWNPDNYGGIKSLNVPSEDVWKPDITTYTASPDLKLLPTVETKAIVYHNGSVTWVPPMTINSRCPLDFTDYPNDVQRCTIKLGSWTHSDTSIDLQLETAEVKMNYFMDTNQEWSLVSGTAERNDNYYPCCPGENYPSIEYNLTIKRRRAPTQHIADSVSTFAVFTSLLMFWLPPDSIHKVMLGMLAEVLLGIVMLYLGIAVKAPAARLKATERICPYMWIVAISVVIETLIINLGRVMGPCRPPRCLAAIAKGCCQPFCVCISRPYPGGDLRQEILHSEKSKKHGAASAQEEWNIVAMAFDRILFIAALLTTAFYYYISK